MAKSIEVTKDNPCAHCGKPDYCYRIEPLSVCNRDHPPAKQKLICSFAHLSKEILFEF